ncbi:MAG: hypothetical protein LDL33_09360 [Desulfomonile sp.]|nr:hypothetical protein [Desulfomonile sp.]
MRGADRPTTYAARMIPAVFAVSFAAIGWQLALMRCLLVARYHHFSFLVISCALLGFGAGGTLLAVVGSRLEARLDTVFRWGLLAFALSMPACFRLGELVPLDVSFSPVNLAANLGWWFLFWIIHLVPFLLAGTLVGLALMVGRGEGHRLYAASLVGSAAGALVTVLLMGWVPENLLVVPIALSVLVTGLVLTPDGRWHETWKYTAAVIVATAGLAASLVMGADRAFPLNIDQYKTSAHARRLVDQGGAELVRTLRGPRGRIDLYTGPSFHTLLSLGSAVSAPNLDLVLRDGFQAGVLPLIDSPGQARFLTHTLAALPYKLLQPEGVLILGDSGGTSLWLARLCSARSIVFVHPDANVVTILREHRSKVLDDPRISVVISDPRAFLDSTTQTFQVIHLAALEGFAAGSSGIGGLREDYLGTVEGFGQCLDALATGGLAIAVRGIQDPPRDNLKIIGTWIEALERRGAANPGRYLLMARDELAFATLAANAPIVPETTARFVEACKAMSWETEWFPGVDRDQTNRVHVLPGPAGEKISWFHHAVERMLSKDRAAFYSSWLTDVRPATDDRPFFYDFFRWESVSKLQEVFGPLWFTRSETGFLVLVLAAVWTAVVAAVLMPAPLLLLRRHRTGTTQVVGAAVVCYFGVLGIAFMALEMSFIQMFTRFLGDPILAAALVMGGFLLFAGGGSAVQPRLASRLPGGVMTLAGGLAAVIVIEACVLPWLFQSAARFPGWSKTLVGLAVIAPLALLMGMPFPWGLSMLHRGAPEAVPAAWAVNGFASVVSTSVAVIMAMVIGFRSLLAAAALLYAFAGLVGVWLTQAGKSVRNKVGPND